MEQQPHGVMPEHEWKPTPDRLLEQSEQEPGETMTLAEALAVLNAAEPSAFRPKANESTTLEAVETQLVQLDQGPAPTDEWAGREVSIRRSYWEAVRDLLRAANLRGSENLPTFASLRAYRFEEDTTHWFGQVVLALAERTTADK
jgi:hypothetical protein